LEQIYYAGKKHRSLRRSKNKFFKSRPRFGSSRRSSVTSQDNSSTSQVLPAITVDTKKPDSGAREKRKGLPPPGKSLDLGPRSQPNPTLYVGYRELVTDLTNSPFSAEKAF
jgi:hypothetical protein